MLKKRVIATLAVKDGIVVQSIGFRKYLPVGRPEIAVEYLNHWGIDEILYLDISASRERRGPDFAQIRKAARHCRVPLTIGGGISQVDHIKELMHCGADKIALNQTLLREPTFITKAASVFGNQCIVASLDAIHEGGRHRVYDYLEKCAIDLSPEELGRQAEKLGAGEILLHSVDRDGSYRGFDLELIRGLCETVQVPVLASGGARNAADFREVFEKTSVSAACAGNFFHFTENSVSTTKAALVDHVAVRLETQANYKDAEFDTEFRLSKKSDAVLEEMLFERIEVERI